jgi:hypothetical protein
MCQGKEQMLLGLQDDGVLENLDAGYLKKQAPQPGSEGFTWSTIFPWIWPAGVSGFSTIWMKPLQRPGPWGQIS